MTPDDLRARLRAGLPALADLVVAEALATPVADLVAPAQAFLADAVAALAASDAAEQALAGRAAAIVARLPADRLGDALPPALVAAARELAELPFRVPRELVLRLLDRAPVRQLLRRQVLRTLVDFGRKATAPFTDNAVTRGLSKLAFGSRSNPTGLGAIRSAVSGEAERRAEGFADTAVDEVIDGIADQLSDPARAVDQAAIRVAILDGLLGEHGSDVAATLTPQLPATLAVARRALGAWGATLAEDVTAALELLLAGEVSRPLGDLLGELGLREAVAAHAARALRDRMAILVEKDAFAAWLAAILA